jgi:rubrerythrin
MKMNLVKLRRLIRERIEASLDGLDEQMESTHPQTFSEFRVWFGELLEQAGAPADLIEAVTDLDRSDNMLITHMMNAWQDLSEEVEGAPDPQQVAELFTHYTMELSVDMGLNERVSKKIGRLLSEGYGKTCPECGTPLDAHGECPKCLDEDVVVGDGTETTPDLS